MKIRKIIVYLCVFAAAASIFTRIIYVNKVYPSVKIHNYNIGDTVNTDEYQICLDSVKVYEKAEWENYIDSTQIGRERDSYKADDKDAALKMRYNPDEDYKVIETELLVKNISGERKTAVMGQLCSVNGIMQKTDRGEELTPQESIFKSAYLERALRSIGDSFAQYYAMLNEEGQKKADEEITRTIKQLELLTKIPEYRKKD